MLGPSSTASTTPFHRTGEKTAQVDRATTKGRQRINLFLAFNTNDLRLGRPETGRRLDDLWRALLPAARNGREPLQAPPGVRKAGIGLEGLIEVLPRLRRLPPAHQQPPELIMRL